MTFGSLFSGVGGFDLGFQSAGMECVWQVEKDKHCNSVLERHWPQVERHGDVNEFSTRTVPDVICGGFPCQDLSVAGKRAGLAGERSGLFHQFMRIVGESSPSTVVIENVPGLLSSNGGKDMAVVLESLAELGYGFAYRILDAQWFGVAQRRRRVFIVGCFGNWRRAAEILFERESLPWDSPPSRTTGARTAAYLTSGVASSSGVNRPSGRRREDDMNLVCPALRSNYHGDNHGDEGHDASEDGTGRGVPIIPLDMRQLSRGEKMTNNRTDGGAPGTGIGKAGDPSPTVCDSHPPAVAYAIQERAVSENPAVGPGGKGYQADIGYTLEARHHQQAVAHAGVRRLTPRECERLQGFPDDHTRWDSAGNELSDSARYRMLGNAVAVPVAFWIGRRLMEATQ